jgi:POT family proton-dependent oligopeptide transporter
MFGAYAAGVYLTPIFGGLIADKWLGRRKAVIIGGVLMAFGHFMMAFEALFFPPWW